MNLCVFDFYLSKYVWDLAKISLTRLLLKGFFNTLADKIVFSFHDRLVSKELLLFEGLAGLADSGWENPRLYS